MKKSILDLGTVLNKEEQEKIKGAEACCRFVPVYGFVGECCHLL